MRFDSEKITPEQRRLLASYMQSLEFANENIAINESDEDNEEDENDDE